MSISYLIRLDDACPTMDHVKWQQVEEILDKFHVCPLVGVIPHNENPHEMIDDPDPFFWDKVKKWEGKGWTIAMHGYNHCYNSDGGLNGLNPLWKRSEFAGLPLSEQIEKISKGVAIFRENGFNPLYFFAPSHTYDKNTLIALKEVSDIRVISDSVGLHPYIKDDFTFIPVLGGKCSKRIITGEWTFCLHPNSMKNQDFINLEQFLKEHSQNFISFSSLEMSFWGRKGLMSRLFSWIYFRYRKLRFRVK